MDIHSQRGFSTNVVMVLNAALVCLALIAVVLGYFVYQKYAAGVSVEVPEQEDVAMEVSESEQTVPSTNSALSDEERAILNPPPPGSPEEDFQNHFQSVQQFAVETDILTVGAGCRMTPTVAKAQLGSTLELRNDDGVSHTIVFTSTLSYLVPAHARVLLPINFNQGAGLYGYACDTNPSAAGMILVTE